jgi:hypothetical protein
MTYWHNEDTYTGHLVQLVQAPTRYIANEDADHDREDRCQCISALQKAVRIDW